MADSTANQTPAPTPDTVNYDNHTGDHQPGADKQFIANAPDDIAFLLAAQEDLRTVIGVVASDIHAYADTLMVRDEDASYLATRESKDVRAFAHRLDAAIAASRSTEEVRADE